MQEAEGIKPDELCLLTDLYQLTMAQSFFDHYRFKPAAGAPATVYREVK